MLKKLKKKIRLLRCRASHLRLWVFTLLFCCKPHPVLRIVFDVSSAEPLVHVDLFLKMDGYETLIFVSFSRQIRVIYGGNTIRVT